MDNSSILLLLTETPGIGWKTVQRIVHTLPDLHEALHLKPDHWEELGIPRSKAESLYAAFHGPALDDKLKRYRSLNVRFVTRLDDTYPELLRHIAHPPWVLYYKGNIEVAQSPCIGMVGTRNPTVYGRKVAETLAHELSECGVCIVSGLARGIDTAAHVGSLRGRGETIGVLGCGIDAIYPPENRGLYRDIEQLGLLLSEYPPQTKAHPGMFPLRNRIIAGLCLGVAVIEAAEKSGSLITVDHALEASRDVFAVPGPITSPKSQGTLSLIKNGAKMVTCVEDILEEYSHRITFKKNTYINNPVRNDLSKDEQKIVGFLSAEPMTFDQLLALSQFTFGHLHSVLLSLLLKKRIEQLPGSAYIII
jgi:DNA processing protein